MTMKRTFQISPTWIRAMERHSLVSTISAVVLPSCGLVAVLASKSGQVGTVGRILVLLTPLLVYLAIRNAGDLRRLRSGSCDIVFSSGSVTLPGVGDVAFSEIMSVSGRPSTDAKPDGFVSIRLHPSHSTSWGWGRGRLVTLWSNQYDSFQRIWEEFNAIAPQDQ